jgi:hypothetical protein
MAGLWHNGGPADEASNVPGEGAARASFGLAVTYGSGDLQRSDKLT